MLVLDLGEIRPKIGGSFAPKNRWEMVYWP